MSIHSNLRIFVGKNKTCMKFNNRIDMVDKSEHSRQAPAFLDKTFEKETCRSAVWFSKPVSKPWPPKFHIIDLTGVATFITFQSLYFIVEFSIYFILTCMDLLIPGVNWKIYVHTKKTSVLLAVSINYNISFSQRGFFPSFSLA